MGMVHLKVTVIYKELKMHTIANHKVNMFLIIVEKMLNFRAHVSSSNHTLCKEVQGSNSPFPL